MIINKFIIPIYAKLILIFRYLGGNLYPFASETSPMLYENDWYFSRLEPPFLLPESLFMQSKLILIFRYLGGNLYPFA